MCCLFNAPFAALSNCRTRSYHEFSTKLPNDSQPPQKGHSKSLVSKDHSIDSLFLMAKLIYFIFYRRRSSWALVRRGVVRSTFSQWGVGVQRARSDVVARIWRVNCQISARNLSVKTSNILFLINKRSRNFFCLFDANTWELKVYFVT